MKTKLSTHQPLREIGNVLLWLGIVYITWTFMHPADPYLQFTKEVLGRYFPVRWFLILHITAGGGAIILGPFQFWKRLYAKGWKIHRIIGTFYLLAVLASSICAVILASTASYAVGWPYAFSLQVWATVWISATFIAYRMALIRKFKQHQEWMVRSYLVTLAFVISGLLLRTPWVKTLGSLGDIGPTFFWLGWAVPLYLYEVVLSVKRKG
ncbi:MAG: DUF2306 domain-containing protein [Chitinophaga sp.]|uniref:DUF2306 domain-containing protein n=1 Tax=Chitinophaga sp. TaxID=1869181 RepID=UPI0025BF5FD6|nr:DUF2306 domain-containing protein [Chitinophaga sp.]MBV8256005.1 DUF2306 domain-containing protein [Chitinophaga sp.]